MKTIAIIGAGPGLGLSLAKKFGTNGFNVAVISRNPEKLSTMVEELTKLNIEAKSYIADVKNLDALKEALQNAKKDFGSIDVLEFSPYGGWQQVTHVLSTTPENVLEQINSYLLPAILSVNEVLPAMQEKGEGAILFTTGISAMFPLPTVGNVGIVMSGIRNYATNLYNELKDKSVYIGHLSIGTMIAPGTEGDPDIIAEEWYNLFEQKGHFEETFPKGFDLTKMY